MWGLRLLSIAGLEFLFSPGALNFCSVVPGYSHRTSRVVCGHAPAHDHHREVVHPHRDLAVPVFYVDVLAFRQVSTVEEEQKNRKRPWVNTVLFAALTSLSPVGDRRGKYTAGAEVRCR